MVESRKINNIIIMELNIENMRLLKGNNWLNSEIVDVCVRIILDETSNEIRDKIGYIDAINFTTIFKANNRRCGGGPDDSSSNHERMATKLATQHFKNDCLIEKEFLMIPIIHDSHWSLTITKLEPSFKMGTMVHLNSLGKSFNKTKLTPVIKFIENRLDQETAKLRQQQQRHDDEINGDNIMAGNEYEDDSDDGVRLIGRRRPNDDDDSSDITGRVGWKIRTLKIVAPQQEDGSNCGPFVLQFIANFLTNMSQFNDLMSKVIDYDYSQNIDSKSMDVGIIWKRINPNQTRQMMIRKILNLNRSKRIKILKYVSSSSMTPSPSLSPAPPSSSSPPPPPPTE